jgi:hypothetical protein
VHDNLTVNDFGFGVGGNVEQGGLGLKTDVAVKARGKIARAPVHKQ